MKQDYLERIWDSLDPENNATDRLIAYELTRRKPAGFEDDPDLSNSDEDSDDDEEVR